jgi:diguanylate cyclase (GGDEF)-like protein
MISIKKLIDRAGEKAFQATLDSYRSVLNAVGDSGVQACPQVGNTLRQNLLNLQAALSPESTPDILHQTGQKVEAEISQWGCAAADYFKQRAGEVKELMLILANTAELTGERDQRYTRRFQEFTGRLQAMAGLDDLRLIRDSLVKSAIDLRACAEAMADETQKSVARLRADVGVYQTRLDDAERLAGQDPLTGLDNRRRVESSIEYRLGLQKAFAILLLDLNGFKQLNDTCGHVAGDELLKQFSAELKSGFRATDTVGRFGGDEFIIVLDAGAQDIDAHIERISRWVFGDYTMRAGETRRKVAVSAAIGVAEWQAGDSLRTLLERADAAMYRDKRARKLA